MASCKDCLHVEICEDFTRYKLSPSKAEEILPILRERGNTCEHFKDRSRFLELPCLPGDKVFLISSYAREIREYKVFSMYLMIAKNNHWFRINLENQRGAILVDYHFSDIGKTVFLTREEAEQAVKGLENNE